MHSDTIPTLDDLTAHWFTGLLRSTGDLADDGAVASVRLEPFGSAESMMSALHRATLTFDGPTDAPTTLIVKLASSSERQRFIADMFKFYEREIRFYDELSSSARVRAPRALLAAKHPSEPYFVLVLEEVTGRRQVDQLDGVGFDDAVTVVRTLADLHASFWGRDFGDLAETFIPMNAPPMHAIIPASFEGDWATARERAAGVMPAEVLALCDRQAAVASQVLEDMMGPNTLAHADCRSDNLLFDDEGIIVLDFQLAAICSGLCDVSYFIAQSVRDEVAAERADELVDVYLARLAEHGVAIDRDDAMRAYRAALVFFLSIPVSLLAGDGLPERSVALGLTMLRRAAAEIVRTGAHVHYS
jgi:hypothetical protein